MTFEHNLNCSHFFLSTVPILYYIYISMIISCTRKARPVVSRFESFSCGERCLHSIFASTQIKEIYKYAVHALGRAPRFSRRKNRTYRVFQKVLYIYIINSFLFPKLINLSFTKFIHCYDFT